MELLYKYADILSESESDFSFFFENLKIIVKMVPILSFQTSITK